LTRRKSFGSSDPRPKNTRQNMLSLNQWLKTPDVDGRYQPIVRDFQAAIPEVLDALPRKYFQQPVSWMTRIFHQFDDVSLMAAQGITIRHSRNPIGSRDGPTWWKRSYRVTSRRPRASRHRGRVPPTARSPLVEACRRSGRACFPRGGRSPALTCSD